MRVNAAFAGIATVVVGATLIGCGESTPDEWDQSAAKVYCGERIKTLLRDPDSYKFESATVTSQSGEYNQYGTATITYRAKNGFGGYTRGSASCEGYEKEGQLWTKAWIN